MQGSTALLDSLHLPAHALLLLCIYVAVASIGALLHKIEKKRQSVERRELSRELSARMTAVTFRAGSLLIPSSNHYNATDHTSTSNCTLIIHTILLCFVSFLTTGILNRTKQYCNGVRGLTDHGAIPIDGTRLAQLAGSPHKLI